MTSDAILEYWYWYLLALIPVFAAVLCICVVGCAVLVRVCFEFRNNVRPRGTAQLEEPLFEECSQDDHPSDCDRDSSSSSGPYDEARMSRGVVRAVCSYDPKIDTASGAVPGIDQTQVLAVKAGDILLVVDQTTSAWWWGRNEDGRQGYFPSSVVEEHADQ